MRGGGGDSVTAVDFMTSCKFLSPGGAVACRADKRLLGKSETRCARALVLWWSSEPCHTRAREGEDGMSTIWTSNWGRLTQIRNLIHTRDSIQPLDYSLEAQKWLIWQGLTLLKKGGRGGEWNFTYDASPPSPRFFAYYLDMSRFMISKIQSFKFKTYLSLGSTQVVVLFLWSMK